MIQRATAVIFAAVIVAACGGPTPPPQPPEGSPTPGAARLPQGGAANPAKPLSELHRHFIEGCLARAPRTPDACECVWQQMTNTFTEPELNAGNADPAKLEQFRARMESACGSNLSEGAIRASVVKSCTGGQPTLTSYCECMYGEIRKTLSLMELADPATTTTERFHATKKAADNTCVEQEIHDGFIKGCAKNENLKDFCDCAWKQVRKVKSVAEIEARHLDPNAMRPIVESACGQLHPR